jgi:hypothetical protein
MLALQQVSSAKEQAASAMREAERTASGRDAASAASAAAAERDRDLLQERLRLMHKEVEELRSQHAQEMNRVEVGSDDTVVAAPPTVLQLTM